MNKDLTHISKYLSFLLRHKPESIGLKLDESGWASINELIEKSTDHKLTNDLIEIVVETNDKQRFSISTNGEMIRANQGHSISIELDLEPIEPPEFLIHGTADRFLEAILSEGLKKMNRHHVHLSESEAVAKSVGGRYGKPILLKVLTSKMYTDGFKFYRSANNVWLVEHVPPKYIQQA